MLPRIAHDLGRGIETHGLRIEERAGEHGRLVAFDPGRHIDQPREGQCMAFGKAVAAETLDLLEESFGELSLIAELHHAPDYILAEMMDRAHKIGRAACRDREWQYG